MLFNCRVFKACFEDSGCGGQGLGVRIPSRVFVRVLEGFRVFGVQDIRVEGSGFEGDIDVEAQLPTNILMQSTQLNTLALDQKTMKPQVTLQQSSI